jgi:hypothetical protein
MKITNSNQFPLPNTNKRFVHLATVVDGLREYMMFRDETEARVYLEEFTGGQLNMIEDDDTWHNIMQYLVQAGVADVTKESSSKSNV